MQATGLQPESAIGVSDGVGLRVEESVLVLLSDGSSSALRARFDTNQEPLYAKLL